MTNSVKPVQPIKRKKSASLERRKARAGWLFVLPFVLGFVLVYLPMIIDSIIYSFSTTIPATGTSRSSFEFVGWANYKEALFVNPDFVSTLVKGLTNMVMEIPNHTGYHLRFPI